MAESKEDQKPARWGIRPRFGPGLLITAAFIGPGTVVTASRAGAERGCGLLWTILFATVGAIVLQSLAARVGIVQRQGLGEAIRDALSGTRWFRPMLLLVVCALGVGNSAYQAGNLAGAATGIQQATGLDPKLSILLLAVVATAVILKGSYRLFYHLLVSLVCVLSISFLFTATVSFPDLASVIQGALIPRLSREDLTIVLALIGTTIVPYNLFLHASTAKITYRTQSTSDATAHSLKDTSYSVGLGGLITAAIMISSSAVFFETGTPWKSVEDISLQLLPTLGEASAIAFALGLFGAGFTSSITAPLATAYAICGILGWPSDPASRRFRGIAVTVVMAGVSSRFLVGGSPAGIIGLAQLANGMLLPIIATFLVILVRHGRKKAHQRLDALTVSGMAIVVLVTLLSAVKIANVFQDWFLT